MIPEKESEIQNAICEYLSLKRYFFWRQNTAPTVQSINGQAQYRRMSKYALRGVPDIIVVHDGKVIFIEVKRPKGKLSEFQEDFQKRCIEEKVDYHIVYSLDDVVLFL